MHTNKDYYFETEADAQSFADKSKVPYDPSADVYVRGPFFNDGINSVTGEQWQEAHWKVSVEVYK